jgi:hypothetical protein
MAKRVFIHIGLEKTGTTTLQHFLCMNAPQLRDREYLYPCDPSLPYFANFGHFPLAGCFLEHCPEFLAPDEHRGPEEVLPSLTADILASSLTVILSCEHLSSRLEEARHLQMLKEAIPADQVKIVCYIRRQDELALALYTTAMRVGHTHRFVSENIQPSDRYFNYEEILDLWASVFGRENLIVRVYERSKLRKHDICSDFLWQIGLSDESGLARTEDRNVSLGAKQAQMLRVINRYLPPFSAENRAAYDRAQAISARILDFLPRGPSIRSLLSRSEKRDILARFDAVNTRVAETYLGGREALGGWYSENIEAQDDNARSGASVPALADFARALVRMGERLFEVEDRVAEPRTRTSKLRGILERSRRAVRRIKPIF